MNSKKMFFVMIGLIVLLGIGIIATIVIGNNTLKSKADRLAELKLEEQILEEQQTALTRATREIEQYAELEQIAKSVVPQDKDQARAVREIVKIAAQEGIAINSISFPSSNLGSRTAPQAQTPSDEGDESSESPSTPSAPPVSQAEPVQGVPGVYSLEMTIVPNADVPVTYYQFLDFLERLENNRRTAQVTSVQVSPRNFNQENPLVNFTLTLNIFVKP